MFANSNITSPINQAEERDYCWLHCSFCLLVCFSVFFFSHTTVYVMISDKTTYAHQHPLIRMQNNPLSRRWICDFCLRESEDIRETFYYHCESCDFDLCFDCVQPKKHPAHVHALKVADITSIYSNWFCDICKCTNKPGEM